MPLKQAMLMEIATRGKFYQSVHCAESIDHGSGNFTRKVIRHITHKYKIFIYKISAYRPQSNGSIECSHHVLLISETMVTKTELEQIRNIWRIILAFTKERNTQRMN